MSPVIQWNKILRWRVSEYLRYERQCPLVAYERDLIHGSDGRPDVLAVDKKRMIVEVEIKVSVADYRKDGKKRHREFAHVFGHLKRQMYYAVPPFMVEEVTRTKPEGWGVLTIENPMRQRPLSPNWDSPLICTHRAATVKDRASIRQCLEMARHLSGTLVSLAKESADFTKPDNLIYLAS